MRRLSLSIGILGLFCLLILLQFLNPKEITAYSEINKLKDNEKIIFSGKVINEKAYEKSKVILLDNNISFECECLLSLKGKNISVLGIIDDFAGKKSILALRIKNK